jgi:hypothetical protein
MDGDKGREIDEEIDRQIDRCKDRQADKWIDGKRETQTYGWT